MSTGTGGVGQYGSVTTSVACLALAAPIDADRERARPWPDFDAVYEQHFDLVWRTARRLGVPESAADDVVQDTSIAAANVPHPEDSERALASCAPAPSADLEQAEAVRLLDALLTELDEDKREVLVLAHLEELTVPEIAELLGANVNTVYARLRAARRERRLP